MEGIRSGPAAEFNFKCPKTLRTLDGEVLISFIPGDDDDKRDWKTGRLPSSTVNTDVKYWFNSSALSVSDKN